MNVPSRLLKPAPLSGRNHQPGPRAHNDHDNEANTPTYPPPDRRSPHTPAAGPDRLHHCLPHRTRRRRADHLRLLPAADEPITFASFLPDVTKAGVVESAGDMTEFAVWGWHTAAGAAPTAIFNGEWIYRDGTVPGSPWTYDVPRFWVEGSYDFYALHPYPFTKDDGSGVTAICTADGITSITLNSPNADIDLMTATATRDYSPATPNASAVGFTFDHLLSRVSFIAISEGVIVNVNYIELSGLTTQGKYSETTGWSSVGEPGSYPANSSDRITDINITENGTYLLNDLLLIPQNQSICKFTMHYTLTHGDGSTEEVKRSFDLPASPVWQAGGAYRYTMTIESDDIVFSAGIAPWNYSTGGIITIK